MISTLIHTALLGLHVTPVPRCHVRMCTSSANEKQLRAEQLALLAEQAELEAEALELKAQQLKAKLPSPVEEESPTVDDQDGPMALRSPLRWLGPYCAIALSLPDCSSPAQKARMLSGDASATGVTLDFVLDTGANTNTINAQVAGPTSQGGLELSQVGSVPAGVGAGGSLAGGATYMLGRCELADVPKAERVVFMSGLTASALPVAAPGGAGLLGTAFLNSFAGGVEFEWGATPPAPGALGATPAPEAPVAAAARPAVTFYGDAVGTDALRADLCAVPVTPLASTLPSVRLRVNGVEIPALLDTGSPVTVLNAAAAAAAGVRYDATLSDDGVAGGSNPFARFGAALKAGRAASNGDVLVVGGVSGPVRLVRAEEGTPLSLGGAEFGDCRPYVGELPGLAALDGLGAAAGPAAVLGTDVLRLRPRMWYTQTQIYL